MEKEYELLSKINEEQKEQINKLEKELYESKEIINKLNSRIKELESKLKIKENIVNIGVFSFNIVYLGFLLRFKK